MVLMWLSDKDQQPPKLPDIPEVAKKITGSVHRSSVKDMCAIVRHILDVFKK